MYPPSASASHLTFGGHNVFRNCPFNRARRQPFVVGNRNATNGSSIYAVQTAVAVDYYYYHYDRGVHDNKIAAARSSAPNRCLRVIKFPGSATGNCDGKTNFGLRLCGDGERGAYASRKCARVITGSTELEGAIDNTSAIILAKPTPRAGNTSPVIPTSDYGFDVTRRVD